MSFYPGYFGFLAWFSLARPLMIIADLPANQAFKASYFFGFLFNLFSLYWLAMVTPPGMVMAVIIVALYYATVLFVFNKLCRVRKIFGIVAFPFLWVGMEYFRTLSEFAFPWSDLGYSQAYYLNILQIVSVISVHGLSLLILIVNVLLWQALRKSLTAEKRLTSVFVSSAIVTLLIGFGWVVTPKYPIGGDYKIALLQGSVPLNEKWRPGNREFSLNLYDSLTTAITDSDTKLVVWPETAAPCYLSHQLECRNRVGEIAAKSHTYHLVGALGAEYRKDRSEQHYNSCYQFDATGALQQRYDKVKLVPFSEQAPYQDYLPFLKSEVLREYLTVIETYNVQWWSDFHPGRDSVQLFDLPEASYCALICFESAFPDFSREGVLAGAEFLVGITNDTWFEHTIGVSMHSQIFITRAVENRIWAVRAANSGLTYIIDGYGRTFESLEPYQIGAISGKISRLDEFSVFTKVGNVAGRFSFLITVSIIGILLAVWVLRKISPGRPS